MTQLTMQSTAIHKAQHRFSSSPLADLANKSKREAARSNVVNRLYRKIPFSLACELHERLIAGDMSSETKRLIREALIHAKAGRLPN